jgi:hypothetical protein
MVPTKETTSSLWTKQKKISNDRTMIEFTGAQQGMDNLLRGSIHPWRVMKGKETRIIGRSRHPELAVRGRILQRRPQILRPTRINQ